MGLVRSNNPQKKGEVIVGNPASASAKADKRAIANKMLAGPPENKAPAALRFANASAQFLAESNQVSMDELRPRVAPGAPVTVEAVRAALTARRAARKLGRKVGDCGCGGAKSPLAEMGASYEVTVHPAGVAPQEVTAPMDEPVAGAAISSTPEEEPAQ